MLIHTYGAKCIGIDAITIIIETNISRGIGIHLVGLADTAVKESLLRTITALEAIGFHIPGKKIVISLAPADQHKNGSGYDLPIALGIIAASEQTYFPEPDKYIIMGELGLDGSVRDIPGALPIAELAATEKMKAVILPANSAMETIECEGIDIYGISTLEEAVRILREDSDCSHLLVRNSGITTKPLPPEDIIDFSDIIGQTAAKRGIEIAAAGGHNVIMIGPPGSGKSSLAKALAGIMPPMTKEEAIVTSKIYSIAGRGNLRSGLIRTRPYRAPHYSASLSAIIGGGGGDGIQPGEVSLAQNGVLFLDEFGQMPKSVMEALRSPLEDRSVTISRLRNKVRFPASFMLVAASNPCPCGYYGEDDRCICTPSKREAYLARLSGPIMDRIDIQLWMSGIPSGTILGARKGETSAEVALRVKKARGIQERRFKDEQISCNAQMSNRQVEEHCHLDKECSGILLQLMEKMKLSMRAWFRIIKVSRTIADLSGAPEILPEHILEAASYRFLDKKDF